LVGSLRRLLEALDYIDLSEDEEHWWAFVQVIVKFVLNKLRVIVGCLTKSMLLVDKKEM
jgi:hypothetical protein